jgi:hypothetical protein
VTQCLATSADTWCMSPDMLTALSHILIGVLQVVSIVLLARKGA